MSEKGIRRLQVATGATVALVLFLAGATDPNFRGSVVAVAGAVVFVVLVGAPGAIVAVALRRLFFGRGPR